MTSSIYRHRYHRCKWFASADCSSQASDKYTWSIYIHVYIYLLDSGCRLLIHFSVYTYIYIYIRRTLRSIYITYIFYKTTVRCIGSSSVWFSLQINKPKSWSKLKTNEQTNQNRTNDAVCVYTHLQDRSSHPQRPLPRDCPSWRLSWRRWCSLLECYR